MPLLPNPNTPKFDNVRTAFKTDVQEHLYFVIFLASIILIGFVISVQVQVPEIVFLSFLPLGFFLMQRYNKQKELFMRKFGSVYGFSYIGNQPLSDSYASKFFSQGHSRQIEHLLHGNYQEHPIELFHYTYKTGSGKSQTTHPYTVCIIDFAGNLPEMAIQENAFLAGDRVGDWHQNKLVLEGPFAEKFHVYATEDHEIEVLEVLTPEIMEWLMAKAATYSIECKGNRLYVIENGNITHRNPLASLIEFSGEIVDRLGVRLARLHDDVAAIEGARNQT